MNGKLASRRHQELLTEQSRGAITELKVKPSFALHAPVFILQPYYTPVENQHFTISTNVGMQRIGSYTPDFTYLRNGTLVVEDCKSFAIRTTPLFQWKAAHFAAQYGVKITVIEARRRRA